MDSMPPMTSVLVQAPAPVLTLGQAKLAAGLDWPDGDPRDDQMAGFVATATSTVELETTLALLEQTRDVLVYGDLPNEIVLPSLCKPLRSVTSITYEDDAGAVQTVDPTTYAFDEARGRIKIIGASWPTNHDPFAMWTIRIVVGWADATLLPPKLFHAVGLLTAHLATLGRDLATADPVIEMPYGYDDCIAPYRPVVCA